MKQYALYKFFAVTLGLLSGVGSASAQNLSIATSQQGSASFLTGSAVAKVVSEFTDYNMRVIPEGGSEIALSRINAGAMPFGIATTPPLAEAWRGGEDFNGVKQENVRVIAVLQTLRTAFMVRKDSNITDPAQFPGKRIADGFGRQKATGLMQDAGLAAAGVAKGSLTPIPVPSGPNGVDDLVAGRLDITHFSLTSGKTREADASVGIRFITIPNTLEAQKAASEVMPGVFIEEVQPSPAYPGIDQPINVIASKYVVATSASADEDMVYKITKALYENKDALVSAYASMSEIGPKAMYIDLGVPYHPGAERFYREVGK